MADSTRPTSLLAFCLITLSLSLLISVTKATAADTVVGTRCDASPGSSSNLKLLDSWIGDVWHSGRVELVTDLVGPTYVRHDAKGTRTVTAAQYQTEITAFRRGLPDVRFIVHDCAAVGDRVWMRWSMTGINSESKLPMRRMGAQIYRLANARLVETWMLALPTDAAWPEQNNVPLLTKPAPSGQ